MPFEVNHATAALDVVAVGTLPSVDVRRDGRTMRRERDMPSVTIVRKRSRCQRRRGVGVARGRSEAGEWGITKVMLGEYYRWRGMWSVVDGGVTRLLEAVRSYPIVPHSPAGAIRCDGLTPKVAKAMVRCYTIWSRPVWIHKAIRALVQVVAEH